MTMITRFSKLLTLLAFPAFLLGASPVFAADSGDPKLESVRTVIAEMFDTIDREDVNKGPIDGWYVIQKGGIVAYVSDDGRYLMQGDLIDLETRTNLTEYALNDTRRELMQDLETEETIAFTPAEVQHTITVFTDVDCTFCRRLHAQIDEYLELGIEVRYVLYPRNGPATPAWATSEQVWCASDRNAALTAAKNDKPFDSAACDAAIIQDHFVLGKQVGLTGTPAIVLEDGTLISGYMPPDQLAAKLEADMQRASAN